MKRLRRVALLLPLLVLMATERWSNGKVGMEGGSYLGQNQWRAAQAAPPSLVTIFPSVASTSIYHDWWARQSRF